MYNSRYGKVAVLMGGNSAEREISLQSGTAVLDALSRLGIDAHAFDTQKNELTELQGYDRVFIMLHGRGGEDGTIQGALELMNIPYTGSGVLSSALAMDKVRTKWLWQGVGLSTPDFMVVNKENIEQVVDTIALPLIIKPAEEGSSIGMAKVEHMSDLMSAVEKAGQYDSPVIAEAWVEGGEYTAAILNTEVLPLIRLSTPHSFYDYDAKYSATTTEYKCPCGLTGKTEQQLQKMAMQAFNAIGATGWGRVDFMIDENKKSWLLEVNTVPGMTNHSLVPMAANASNRTFEQLVEDILVTSFRL